MPRTTKPAPRCPKNFGHRGASLVFFGVEEMVGDQKFFIYSTVIAPSIVEFDRRMDTGVLSDDDPGAFPVAP